MIVDHSLETRVGSFTDDCGTSAAAASYRPAATAEAPAIRPAR